MRREIKAKALLYCQNEIAWYVMTLECACHLKMSEYFGVSLEIMAVVKDLKELQLESQTAQIRYWTAIGLGKAEYWVGRATIVVRRLIRMLTALHWLCLVIKHALKELVSTLCAPQGIFWQKLTIYLLVIDFSRLGDGKYPCWLSKLITFLISNQKLPNFVTLSKMYLVN